MYYLLEDNRIIDSTNEKDISRLKWDYNCNFHNEKIYFYKPRNNYNCKEACGEKGSFCVGCKDAFKAKFNKIKKQSENVFDLIEKGAKPEEARQILPNCTASTIVVTGTLEDWKKFLHLRVDEHAQREIREIANNIMHYLHLTKSDIGL